MMVIILYIAEGRKRYSQFLPLKLTSSEMLEHEKYRLKIWEKL